MKNITLATMVLALLNLSGCSTAKPINTVSKLDLDRFMGDWYVIASIPTVFEKNIFNAIERYDRVSADTVQTTFSYYKDGFDGKKHKMTPVGYVQNDGSNAIWKMQFVWPFKADYRVVYIDEQYNVTVVGREKRDYVWIMSRKPIINNDQYQEIVAYVESLGYDISKLQKVPQKW